MKITFAETEIGFDDCRLLHQVFRSKHSVVVNALEEKAPRVVSP